MDTTQDDLLGVPELARILNTTESAIRTRLARGTGVPERYADSSKVLWLRSDVDKYLHNLTTLGE
jgi:hypothetical protein